MGAEMAAGAWRGRAGVALVGGIIVLGTLWAATATARPEKVIRAVLIFDQLIHREETFQAGDNFTTVGRVVEVDGKSHEGRLGFACQIIDVGAGAGECTYSFALPRGQLTGSGEVRDDIDFPITGGTGAYAGLTGVVTITREREDGPRFAVFSLHRR
jgi:hypothetical protein